MKTYQELITLDTFEERYEYLKDTKRVGDSTFGFSRCLNQALYNSEEWKTIRRKVILRDDGNDLGIPGHQIQRNAIIHHINPITEKDIIERSSKVFDLNNLITVSDKTHKAIHYGTADNLTKAPIARTANDTCPWKK